MVRGSVWIGSVVEISWLVD